MLAGPLPPECDLRCSDADDDRRSASSSNRNQTLSRTVATLLDGTPFEDKAATGSTRPYER